MTPATYTHHRRGLSRHRAAALTVTPGGVVVDFDAANDDIEQFGFSYVTGTATAEVSGVYLACVTIAVTTALGLTALKLELRRGSTIIQTQETAISLGIGVVATINLSTLVQLEAGDEVTVRANTSGASVGLVVGRDRAKLSLAAV